MKALVIGGSNGLGLAIADKLISRGFFVNILDRCEPEKDILDFNKYDYRYCNLLYPDESLFLHYAEDPEVNVLVITAGIGRVADFEYHHISEIHNMMTVNATSTIKIIKLFYDRIKSEKRFYTAIIGSIAGLMSSPATSVYAASKAAVCRFTESVNVELNLSGTSNRILNVAPSSFKGSRFYGEKNQLELLESLSSDVVEHLFNSDELFIPQYDETFKAVLERYYKDPHEYGIHSYKYKSESGRIYNKKKAVIGYLSGTFDLFHVGHLNLLEKAKQNCDYLIVGVHKSGQWKGKETFIPFDERVRIVEACKYVDKVVESCPEDSQAWDLWHYDKLFVGSDYKGTERFMRYEEYFKDKGVKIVYFPYTKGTSSTQIRNMIVNKTENTDKK